VTIDERTDAQARIVRAMERMSRLVRDVSQVVAGKQTGTRATVTIARLLDSAGEVGVGDVAQALRIDVSVASRQVSELVAEGLVERTVADGDRRARNLRLTPAGREYADRLREGVRRFADETFADWSAAELGIAADVFERIVASIAGTTGCPPYPERAPADPPVPASVAG
jgi:DNA-binding MarR family transcriptional regulator